MEAVQWVGPDSALSHDSVLALHGLAAANPRVLRVVTPHRVRKTHPRRDIVILRSSLPADDLTHYFGIPSTTVARALIDSRDLVRGERLFEAAEQAHREGLLLETERDAVIAGIEGRG
jgi:predicted transcriptional regulator of viral defense system